MPIFVISVSGFKAFFLPAVNSLLIYCVYTVFFSFRLLGLFLENIPGLAGSVCHMY